MPFVASIRLEDAIDERAVTQCARRITDRAGDRLLENTRRNTPVDRSPEPRGGRLPGTLRDSVHRTMVEAFVGPGGGGFRVRVRTEDPIAPHVEWDTRPHIIRPRADRAPATVLATGRPRGTVQDGRAALSWSSGGKRRFAKEVHHPGTKGAHMFSLGALKTRAELDAIAAGPLARFERDFVQESRLAA